MNNLTEFLVALVGSGGLISLIPTIARSIRAWRSGRATEEKRRNRSALGRLVAETERADTEAAHRRRMQEYASTLRRMLIEAGVPETAIPDWPSIHRETTFR